MADLYKKCLTKKAQQKRSLKQKKLCFFCLKRVPGQVSIQLLKKNMFCQLYSTTNMKAKKITK